MGLNETKENDHTPDSCLWTVLWWMNIRTDKGMYRFPLPGGPTWD